MRNFIKILLEICEENHGNGKQINVQVIGSRRFYCIEIFITFYLFAFCIATIGYGYGKLRKDDFIGIRINFFKKKTRKKNAFF